MPIGFAGAGDVVVVPVGVFVAAGVAAAAGGGDDVAAFLSSGVGVDDRDGVAEVNALDCAHTVSAKRTTKLAASARRFIVVGESPRSVAKSGIASH